MAENAHESLKTVAYLHPVSENCVSTNPVAYNAARELVLKTQAEEQIEDLQEGLRQWRAIACEATAFAAHLQESGVGLGTVAMSAADMRTISRLAAWQRIDAQVAQRAPVEFPGTMTPAPDRVAQMVMACANIDRDKQGWFAVLVDRRRHTTRVGRGLTAWDAIRDAHQDQPGSGATHG